MVSEKYILVTPDWEISVVDVDPAKLLDDVHRLLGHGCDCIDMVSVCHTGKHVYYGVFDDLGIEHFPVANRTPDQNEHPGLYILGVFLY